MKSRLDNLIGFTIAGSDGEVGKIKEFFFDDNTWVIRYIIVETGRWLLGRKVLLSPQAIIQTDWVEDLFKVNLTLEQIKNSPHVDTDKPFAHQHENDLYGYYPWGVYYWSSDMGMGISYRIAMNQTIQYENDVLIDDASDDNPHLRSTDRLTGYSINGTDGEIGHLEDFVIDHINWQIDFILVDTGNWSLGKKVLIAPKMIKEINWGTTTIIVNATENQVKNSPQYHPSQELSGSYAAHLQKYYGTFM